MPYNVHPHNPYKEKNMKEESVVAIITAAATLVAALIGLLGNADATSK